MIRYLGLPHWTDAVLIAPSFPPLIQARTLVTPTRSTFDRLACTLQQHLLNGVDVAHVLPAGEESWHSTGLDFAA
jgi:hypothetical protein